MRFLTRWFWRSPPQPNTRLTEEEVRAIAHDAAAAAAYESPEAMICTTLQKEQDRTIWRVSSATIGSGLLVSIDDATGEVIDVRRRGIR